MFEFIVIASLSVVGFSAGVIEFRKGGKSLGTFATVVCTLAFVVNFF